MGLEKMRMKKIKFEMKLTKRQRIEEIPWILTAT
jgi:hypothetical protein